MASALHAVCSQGDNVLVHAPTYIGFTGTLNNNGYHIIHSPLKKDEEGIWRMDFEDMEEKIVKNKIHAAIFLFTAQSDRSCMGALGNRESNGNL